MITRKIAKQVIERWERDKQGYGAITLDGWITQFPDEPTPDEMLAEMREWAEKNEVCFQYQELSFLHKRGYGVNIWGKTIEDLKASSRFELSRADTITEAYRQFKEATHGDTTQHN